MPAAFKIIAAALAGVATAAAMLAAAFLSGRRRGRADTAQAAADAASKKKEAEIAQTDAADLVAGDDRSGGYRRRKDELVADFVRRTENLL